MTQEEMQAAIEALQQADADKSARLAVLEQHQSEMDTMLETMRTIASAANSQSAKTTETAPAAAEQPAEQAPGESPFQVGDRVRVKSGDWGNNQGDIIAIDTDAGLADISFGYQQGTVELELLERL